MNAITERAPHLQTPPGEMSLRGAFLSANKINAGTLRAINVFAATHATKGSYLTQACLTSASTIYLEDTSDFSASGSGEIISAGADRDAFSWTGKTSTTLTGCSGVLGHISGSLVIPYSKNIFISDAMNEMRFFGDRGDGTVEELASIGIKQDVSDYIIADIGSLNSGNSRLGLRAQSYDGIAIIGGSQNDYGVYGWSINDVGILCAGGKGPICLIPSTSASAPSHSAAKGTLWLTSGCVLYVNTNGSTTWQKVGAQ